MAQNKPHSSLVAACLAGDRSLVVSLLEHVVEPPEQATAALFAAASGGHVEIITALCTAKCSVNATGKNSWTPLLAALAKSQQRAAEALVLLGASTNARNSFDSTALAICAERGLAGCIPLLVQHGALLEAQVLEKPPLLWAAIKGRTACASCLLQLRAKVDGAAPNGLTPLVAASKQGNTSLVKLLCSAKAALETCMTRGGESALMAAAREGFSSTAATLLLFNAALDSHCTSKAPLLLAAENGWLSTVEVILQAASARGELQCTMDARSTKGKSAIGVAASAGNDAVVDCLIRMKADLENKCAKGRSPLLNAARHGHGSTVAMLLVNGSDSSVRSNPAWLPDHSNHQSSHRARDPEELALYFGHKRVERIFRAFSLGKIRRWDRESHLQFPQRVRGSALVFLLVTRIQGPLLLPLDIVLEMFEVMAWNAIVLTPELGLSNESDCECTIDPVPWYEQDGAEATWYDDLGS